MAVSHLIQVTDLEGMELRSRAINCTRVKFRWRIRKRTGECAGRENKKGHPITRQIICLCSRVIPVSYAVAFVIIQFTTPKLVQQEYMTLTGDIQPLV